MTLGAFWRVRASLDTLKVSIPRERGINSEKIDFSVKVSPRTSKNLSCGVFEVHFGAFGVLLVSLGAPLGPIGSLNGLIWGTFGHQIRIN